MTALVGGSVLLIVVAATALILGWASADGSLIWTSIGASVLAGILLALGYYRSKAELETPGHARRTSLAPRPPAATEPEGPPAATEPEGPPAATPLPTIPSTETGSGGGGEVIVDPDRKRYHRPECRFAGASRAQAMSLDAARARRYDPCGVCKPDAD
jgi:hypothetical protein